MKMITNALIEKAAATKPPEIKTGRKPMISREIIETLRLAIERGMPKHRAAPLAGISIRTYYNWMGRANEVLDLMAEEGDLVLSGEDMLYVQFLHTVQQAESVLMQEGIEAILAEGPSGYKWLFERLFREEFGNYLEVKKEQPLSIQLELPGMIEDGEE
jgi:predicted DNA-binding protein (UPF0251 family)